MARLNLLRPDRQRSQTTLEAALTPTTADMALRARPEPTSRCSPSELAGRAHRLAPTLDSPRYHRWLDPSFLFKPT